MNNFRALNQAGYKLKQKHPQCRRNIKFDDETCNIVMEFRTEEGAAWKRLLPDQARQLGGASAIENVSAADMTSLLGENADAESVNSS